MNLTEEYASYSDEYLVERIQKTRDIKLFGILYDRYSDKIYNKCISFTKSEMESEDLVQDIFLKLFIKINSFQGKSKFSTWLYSFTYNFCINYITRTQHRQKENYGIDLTNLGELHIDIDDSSLFQIKVTKLKKALDIIKPEDKMILLLKYQDDATVKDICNLLDLGESAVKMRLKRAKAQVIEICNKLD